MNNQSSTDLKNRIRQICLEHGFAEAGFAVPEYPSSFEFYEQWLVNGHHGDMTYLESERHIEYRKNILNLFQECRSILVLLMRYPDPKSLGIPDGGHGRVASYALGQDYHEVLKARVETMMPALEQTIGHSVKYMFFTDSAPILEHDLAHRAGLGWVGKNSLLLNRNFGSYFFIAEILMDVEIEPDQPFQSDHCGGCTKCIDSCPTKCILSNRTIDARKCISFLTIENKKEIPVEFREAVGDWLFGCDVCQLVCPWNQRLEAYDVAPAFLPGDNSEVSELLPYLSISKAEFNRKFKHSPVGRTKQRDMARNAVVVLGNRNLPESIDVLSACLLNHEESQVRAHAAWALSRPGEETKSILKEVLLSETDKLVVQEIQSALKPT